MGRNRIKEIAGGLSASRMEALRAEFSTTERKPTVGHEKQVHGYSRAAGAIGPLVVDGEISYRVLERVFAYDRLGVAGVSLVLPKRLKLPLLTPRDILLVAAAKCKRPFELFEEIDALLPKTRDDVCFVEVQEHTEADHDERVSLSLLVSSPKIDEEQRVLYEYVASQGIQPTTLQSRIKLVDLGRRRSPDFWRPLQQEVDRAFPPGTEIPVEGCVTRWEDIKAIAARPAYFSAG